MAAIARSLALLITALLVACGGGGTDTVEDDRSTIGPPDCRAEPALCA